MNTWTSSGLLRRSPACTRALAGTLLVLCGGFLSASALALPIVAGSDYRLRLVETNPQTVTLDKVLTFDGIAEAAAITPSGTATITESQSALGGGQYRVVISVVGDADLFGNGGTGFAGLNIGGGNPFDLTGSFVTVSNLFSFFLADGSLLASGGIPAFNGNTWDGTWVSNGQFGGFNPAAPFDIRRIDLTLVVADAVPEPATVVLLGLGLAGIGWSRRKPRR